MYEPLEAAKVGWFRDWANVVIRALALCFVCSFQGAGSEGDNWHFLAAALRKIKQG